MNFITATAWVLTLSIAVQIPSVAMAQTASPSQTSPIIEQAIARPINGVKGLGIGLAGGGLLGLYVANAFSVSALPDRCVAHARYISTVKGSALCYAGWVPLFGISAPIGLVGGMAVGAPIGAWYGLKHGRL